MGGYGEDGKMEMEVSGGKELELVGLRHPSLFWIQCRDLI